MIISAYPHSKVGLSLLDQVMMKPVEKPAAMVKTNGSTSRRPERVAESRRTA